MKVRAKMVCSAVTKTASGSEIVELNAVYASDNNAEDNTYAKATPQASVEMTIDNPDAHGAFEPGKRYYVDFSPAK
jgi:hypothetical protein